MQVTKIETKYKSKSKDKEGTPFLIVKEATYEDNSKYVYSSRPNQNSIKFILVDLEKNAVALVKELQIPRNYITEEKDSQTQLTSFGGSIEKDTKNLLSLVLKETREETGYKVSSSKIKYVGVSAVSNQSDELAYMFVVDVTNLTPSNRELEKGETDSMVQWLTEEDFYTNADVVSITILTKYLRLVGRFK